LAEVIGWTSAEVTGRTLEKGVTGRTLAEVIGRTLAEVTGLTLEKGVTGLTLAEVTGRSLKQRSAGFVFFQEEKPPASGAISGRPPGKPPSRCG
jgi:hypothetical protein